MNDKPRVPTAHDDNLKTNPFGGLAALKATLPAAAPAPSAERGEQVERTEKKKPPEFGQKVVVRHERKGHGGKTVTVVEGILPAARAGLVQELKRKLGCGAREEDGTVVLQGDLVDRAARWLEARGARVVRGSK